jgi:hypothetical protein
VFRYLTDPANHPVFDTSGMVRSAATRATLSRVGDVFVMNMHNAIKGNHQVENHVIVYELDRAIGWAPAQPDRPPAGHTWTWRLASHAPGRTLVSLTYDWTAFTHTDMLAHLPVVNREQLQASLDLLAEALDQEHPADS